MFTVKAIKKSGAIHLYEYETLQISETGVVISDSVYHFVSGEDAHYDKIYVTDSNGKTVSKIVYNGDGKVLIH